MVGAFEKFNLNLNLNFGRYSQTNPEGSARLTRRLIMDLAVIVIFEIEYSRILSGNPLQCFLDISFMPKEQYLSDKKTQDSFTPKKRRSG